MKSNINIYSEQNENYSYISNKTKINLDNKTAQNEQNRPEIDNSNDQNESKDNSSDLTSNSFTPTKAFSQTSESFFIPSELNIKPFKIQNSFEEKHKGYFDDIIDYFRKTKPEKFVEYKNTKNFMPKKKETKLEYSNYDNMNEFTMSYINNNKNDDNKQMNNSYYMQIGNNYNYYNNIINGNIIYFFYNNFFFNYPMNKNKTTPEINKKENTEIKGNKNTNDKKDKTNIEEEKNEIIENNKDNDIEIIYVKNKSKKYDQILDRKKERNYFEKQFNDNNLEKNIDLYEGKKYRKKNSYYSFNEPNDTRIYSNKYNSRYKNNVHYNKFNDNFGGKRKNYFDENYFYRRKYYKQMYY